MSYTLRQVKTGWEIQNGSSITVTVPDLKSVEKAVTMLSENSKMTVGEMLTKKPVAVVKDLSIIQKPVSVDFVLKNSKKPLTVSEVIALLNPNADADEKKQIHGILSILGRKKILKRKKNAAGIFEYSVKA